jgi:hypothetical protein
MRRGSDRFLECGGNPDSSGDTALDYEYRRWKAPSTLRSAGALQIELRHHELN